MSTFVTYPELRDLGIGFSYGHLRRLMAAGEFPQARRLSKNRVAWIRAELEEFRDSRPPAAAAAPVLWPPGAPPEKRRFDKPVGRRAGSRVISGKVFSPEQIAALGLARRDELVAAGDRVVPDAAD